MTAADSDTPAGSDRRGVTLPSSEASVDILSNRVTGLNYSIIFFGRVKYTFKESVWRKAGGGVVEGRWGCGGRPVGAWPGLCDL